MKILMVASECAPVAKVGGLGDVVHGLSRELHQRGHDVAVILPKYDCMRYDHIWDLAISYENLWVPWNGGVINCTIWFGHVDGLASYFIEPHAEEQFFNRGTYYGFWDDAHRFGFFSRAALEFMLKANLRPDIIHTHDWQTALIPVMLYEIYESLGLDRQRVCHTIHNFKHQGTTGRDLLYATGLHRADYFGDVHCMGDDFTPGAINHTKGAITYANFVTTVSPKHAFEARHSDQGYGLGHTLYRFQDKFGGILNGLDYDTWNPMTDPYLRVHYDRDTLERKSDNKQALRERLMLQQVYKPMVAYVGRLDTQKGVHLIRHALFRTLEMGGQFVLLGAASERGINDDFWHLKNDLNDNPDCHLEIGFDEALAHQIYAGVDLFVVPSLFEPCGLTQMIALRYGTVPVVRQVGGLADTVFDWNHSDLPLSKRNGFVFEEASFAGLESALDRGIALWKQDPHGFQMLMQAGMRYDYSWRLPVEHYLNIYRYIRC
ncbi:glycogen/starch synthase, ADP-glucose type [Magnetococcus marinus MC-1]|uniref:Glycogen synthase n=1 Tax=Magnetococcus marinus (strain ATCC BAA-1437 / JCM 17883 / MC-1) TaxID=156889 RepID=A0L7T3_MAGMM|nr:glycogen synthase [Magnetococcus marinus]ABK44026.1 glycogen/starch synthase, ADP-glucose type [Magnetococcus marinus MC-1]